METKVTFSYYRLYEAIQSNNTDEALQLLSFLIVNHDDDGVEYHDNKHCDVLGNESHSNFNLITTSNETTNNTTRIQIENCNYSDTNYARNNNNEQNLSKILLEKQKSSSCIGSSTDDSKPFIWSMIEWASFNGNEEIVKNILLLTNRIQQDDQTHLLKRHRGDEPDTTKHLSPSSFSSKHSRSQDSPISLPLHRASQRGHLSICWLLLLGSYSLHDKDEYANTPLHIAAANGHESIVSCFIHFGANRNSQNVFHLKPLQVACNDSCRDLLLQDDLYNNDEEDDILGLKSFENSSTNNNTVIVSNIERQQQQEQLSKYYSIQAELIDLSKNGSIHKIQELKRTIDFAHTFGILQEIITYSKKVVQRLELEQNLKHEISTVKDNMPIVTLSKFESVRSLQMKVNVTKSILSSLSDNDLRLNELVEEGEMFIQIATSELCLKTLFHRLEGIQVYASLKDGNSNGSSYKKHSIERNLNILKEQIIKAKDLIITTDSNDSKGLACDANLLIECENIHSKLSSELNLFSIMNHMPTVRLPVESMTSKQAKEYWCEEDIGHIEQTEEYPLPPSLATGTTTTATIVPSSNSEVGDYIWIKSASLQSLENAVEDLQSKLDDAMNFKNNDDDDALIRDGKMILETKKDEIRQLKMKDEVDKASAIAIAQKAAKKLLKQKKSKKKNPVK